MTEPRTSREAPGAPSLLASGSRRVLSPPERISEVLFGLIMALTFTGSLSVASGGREEVRTMLIGALGCNLAWGIVDGVFYLVNALVERGRGIAILRELRRAPDAEHGRRLIADALPPVVAAVLRSSDLDFVRQQLAALPEPPARALFTRRDLLGALGVLFMVFLATLPVALPFVLVHQTRLALRISNAVALLMLFLGGHALGRYMGRSPAWVGAVMTAVGTVLVVATIALGG